MPAKIKYNNDVVASAEPGQVITVKTEGSVMSSNVIVDLSAIAGGSYEEGKQAEYDAFWDAYQEDGTRTSYSNMFFNSGWNDVTYNPKYDIVATGNSGNIFSWSRITDTKVSIDISGTTRIGEIFGYAKDLKTIRKLIVSETTPFTNLSFTECKALENIVIEGIIGVSFSIPDSPLLTTDSVNSIINALKDLTGATAQTLTFHATVGGNLTEEQKAAITAKNWTLVY